MSPSPSHAGPSSRDSIATGEPPSATPDPVELARALVAIPSVNPSLSPDGSGEARIAEVCAGWLRGWGFGVEVVETEPERASVLARVGRGRPRTILNGHLDTVGVDGMSIEPFDPMVRDGMLHGRGSCDMKGGIAAVLAAAARLAAAPDSLPGELVVALTADEEHSSIGLRDLLDRGLGADRAIVAEPTSLALQVANQGFLWARVRVGGKAAHGSRADVGRDAIRGAGRILAGLDEYEAELARGEPHPLLGHGTIHAGTIRGGSAPSVYPAECEFVLEARTLPGEAPPDVLGRLERMAARALDVEKDAGAPLEVEVREELFRPGGEVPRDAAVVRELEHACRAEGLEPRIEGMSAWVESAWFVEAGIPALCFGPGSIADAHSSAESVPVEEIRGAARVLERFAGGSDRVGS